MIKMGKRRPTATTEYHQSKCPVSGSATDLHKIPQRMDMNQELPRVEVWAYICLWSLGVFYSIYAVYRSSIDFRESLNDYFLVSGWRVLGQRKDTSNFEWDFWSGWFLEMWPWMVGHFIISTGCRRSRYIGPKGRDTILTLYAFFVLFWVLGWKAVLLFIGHVVIMYTSALLGSRLLVWLNCILLLTTLNIDVTVKHMKNMLDHDPYEKKFYLMLFTLAMANLRYTGAALEICQRNVDISQNRRGSTADKVKNSKIVSPREDEKISERRKITKLDSSHSDINIQAIAHNRLTSFTFLDMLVYVFYLPLAFTGPVVPFDSFLIQLNRGWSDDRRPPDFPAIFSFAKGCTRVIFWAFIIELSLHYLYFNCLQLDVPLLERLPLWALAGVGYCQGQFFMMKYVVLFGVPGLVASLDAVKTPDGPKCIARIHLYSDMWKYFDRGLHAFLTRYIYVPLGGSRRGFPRQLLAALLCFGFVYYWHGAEDYLLIWVTLNFVGISLETMAGHLSKMPLVRHLEDKTLGPRWSRRLHALLSVPLLAMSALAIFYFFGGRRVGNVFVQRLIVDGFPVSTMTVSLFLYFCVQTSMEVARWERRKVKIS